MNTNPRNPFLTVDIIIEINGGIVLIERKNTPHGWAIPGGFVDYGESAESAAIREAKEETNLDVTLIEQFHTYSKPDRDPRFNTASVVFIAKGAGILKADDDAKNAGIFIKESLPPDIVFDHKKILDHYFQYREGRKKSEIFKY
jgi:ADP-ribose pyrophosphatase YjhB (NUDIX family)